MELKNLFKRKCSVFGCKTPSSTKIESIWDGTGSKCIIRLCEKHNNEYEEA